MSKRNALAFAAGFGGAYLKGKERQQEMERQKVEDAWRDEQRGAWREEQADKKAMRVSLADAMRPTSVDSGYRVTSEAGSDAFTKDPDAADMMGDMVRDQRHSLGRAYRAGGQTFADRQGAQTAATEYNSDPAMLDRMSNAVAPMDPAKSLSLRTAASGARKAAREEEEAKIKKAKLVKTEGVENAYRSALARDPDGIMQAFNSTGQIRLSAPPKLVETRTIKTPYGEIEDDVWEGVAIGPDGKEMPIRRSTQQLAMQIYDVKDLIKDQAEAQKIGLKHRNAIEIEGMRSGRESNAPSGYRRTADGGLEFIPGGPADPANKSQGNSTLERMMLDGRRKDAVSEERDAKKEADAIRKQLQSPMMQIAKEGSQAWNDAQALRAQLADVENRAREAAARKATFDKALDEMTERVRTRPGLSTATPSTAAPSRSQSERESDRLDILNRELEKARASGNAADVAALEREIARAGGAPTAPQARSLAAAQRPQQTGQPPRISTAAERDALPPGTRYVAPNGKIYIKQ
jgi:hypothetical protein